MRNPIVNLKNRVSRINFSKRNEQFDYEHWESVIFSREISLAYLSQIVIKKVRRKVSRELQSQYMKGTLITGMSTLWLRGATFTHNIVTENILWSIARRSHADRGERKMGMVLVGVNLIDLYNQAE